MALRPLTYLNFSEQLHYREKETDIEAIARFFEYVGRFQEDLNFFKGSAFYIIDYARRSYDLITGQVRSMSGYHAHDFLEGGLDFVVDIYQKDDFRMWNGKIAPQTFAFLKEQPQSEHIDFVFEFTYRLRDKNGQPINIWQKGSFVTDPKTGLPLYGFGVVSNISSIKKDNTMIRTISKHRVVNGEDRCNIISTDYFQPLPEEAQLTKREREILLWLAEGLSSKQLADKLKLSTHTILNHRKNMLRKTNCKNSAELVRYALLNKIL